MQISFTATRNRIILTLNWFLVYFQEDITKNQEGIHRFALVTYA